MAFALLLASCTSVRPLRGGLESNVGDRPPVLYSMIFIVHGDGDYLFHDTHGKAFQADVEEVAAARTVAERNPQAEVFIFHQRRRRHTLIFFPRREGRFEYYRGGHRVAEEKYWRGQGTSRFDPEVALVNRYRSEQVARPAMFVLYAGHEIPESAEEGYDRSMRSRTFSLADLATGLSGLTAGSGKVDLLVLSTCFGGTPYTVDRLSPYARTIVASPDNLHLSYFDLQSLDRMTASSAGTGLRQLATDFSRSAFDRLSAEVQTAVTVALYDTDMARDYVEAALPRYLQASAALEGMSRAARKHKDCASDSSYVLPSISQGVEILYRAPRFGRSRQVTSHSGWECWEVPQSTHQGPRSQP